MSETTIPTYDEALAMLAAKAEEGSVTALERVLRSREAEEVDEVGEAIDRILNRPDP